MMETVDSKLSEFTTRTAVDPGLGRDLLEGMYHTFHVTTSFLHPE